MPISSSTLFHFTSSADNLINILTNEFSPRYCLEDLRVMEGPDVQDTEVAIPMVCFCDLPLSQLGDHLGRYGDYGIGMTKQWAKRHCICPVFYCYQDAHASTLLGNVLGRQIDVETDDETERTQERITEATLLASYIKPYEGRFWRRGQYIEGVRFYDEREWRFVPKTDHPTVPQFLSREGFFNDILVADYNNQLSQNMRIPFTPNDIKYIIVAHENQIIPMLNSIERIKGRYSSDERNLLKSRVTSADQIREDF